MKIAVFCAIVLFAVLAVSSANNVPKDHPCACPRIYRPVCASNGRTFSNDCEFNCVAKQHKSEHLRIVRNGPCHEPREEHVFA